MMATGADAAGVLRERLRADPVFFCREVLGVRPWWKQEEVLRALRDHDRVAVRSGHGTGKSFIAAAAALWFLYAHYPAKVVTTAPTWVQVRQILWNEIRRLHAGARVPLGGKVLEERIRLNDGAFAIGVSTDEAERFQGFHADSVLVILDEAPGVRPEIWEAAQTLLTGRVGKLLAIGNPTRPAGLFYEAFGQDSDWTQVRISCLDSPNVRDDTEKNGSAWPQLVTRRWVDGRRREWGERSALWKSRVLGEFPEEEQSLLIPRSWLEESPREYASSVAQQEIHDRFDTQEEEIERSVALKNRKIYGVDWVPDLRLRLGVDVAREGEDATVFLLRCGRAVVRAREARGWSTMAVAGEVVAWMRRCRLAPEQVFIDDTGLGAGVTDRLREQGYDVCAVIGAARAEDAEHYLNLRAECFWRLRGACDPEGAEPLRIPPQLRELRRELAALTYEFTSGGAIKITDKVTLRGRLSGSPNYADALAMTYALREDFAADSVLNIL